MDPDLETVSEYPPLSRRQREAFAFISGYIARTEVSPTLAEIADGIGARSVTSAVKLVDILERKGYIDRPDGRARSIRILSDALGETGDERTMYVPLLEPDGYAGSSTLRIDRVLLGAASRPADCVLARVGDTAMTRVGIHRDDLVLTEATAGQGLVSGDLIACVLDGMTVVRRYYDSLLDIRLVPEDRSYSVFSCPKPVRAVQLLGRVIGLIRRF